jgi:hypothetical protein
MAIKGKRRSRGGRTSIGAAPRPQFVVPRKPVFQRTGVRVFLILLLLAGIVTGVVVGINVRNSNRKRDQARGDVREFQVRVEAALSAEAIGQTQGTGPLILPELGQTISELQGGQIPKGQVKQTKEQLETWNTNAKEAAEKIALLDVGTSEYVEELNDSKNLIRQSLIMYAGLARELAIALDLEGKSREDLVQNIVDQYPSAATVFDTGWRTLQTLRSDLGIAEPIVPPGLQQPGVPGVPAVPAIPTP